MVLDGRSPHCRWPNLFALVLPGTRKDERLSWSSSAKRFEGMTSTGNWTRLARMVEQRSTHYAIVAISKEALKRIPPKKSVNKKKFNLSHINKHYIKKIIFCNIENLIKLRRKLFVVSCVKWDNSFIALAKFSEKLILLAPLIRTRTCAYQEERNVSFSENFENVVNEWSQSILWYFYNLFILMNSFQKSLL